MLTLTKLVSNKLTFLNAHAFLGRNDPPGKLSMGMALSGAVGVLRQATLERRSADIRLARLSMLIGRPIK